jgi:Leucine-rich repeat (LRR) protein
MPRLRAPFLRSLNLSGNFLYELADTDLDTLPALISLDLSRNRLTELRIQLLERMPQLRVLNLSENGQLKFPNINELFIYFFNLIFKNGT